MSAVRKEKTIRIYNSEDVRRLLDLDGCREAVRAAMIDLAGEAEPQPLRTILTLGPGKLFGLMPGFLCDGSGFGSKVVSVFADPQRPGRSAHRGAVLSFDRDSGALACIADAEAVTEIRTGAASAVATDVLARPDASRLAVFGTGVQAASHIRAIARVRRLSDVVIWGRSRDSAERLAEETRARLGLAARPVADGEEAAQADIICTVTGAHEPILLGQWVRPGTHVNVVGSSYDGPVEIDDALVVRSRFVADSRGSVLAAGAEFLAAKRRGLVGDNHVRAEIGEVLNGSRPGRTSPEEITVYKSLGHIVQDLAAVHYLQQRSEAEEARAESRSAGFHQPRSS